MRVRVRVRVRVRARARVRVGVRERVRARVRLGVRAGRGSGPHTRLTLRSKSSWQKSVTLSTGRLDVASGLAIFSKTSLSGTRYPCNASW